MQEQITINQSLTTVDLFKASILFALGNRRMRTIFYLIPSIMVITSALSIALANKEERLMEAFKLISSILMVAFIFCALFFILSFLMIIVKPNLFKNISYTFNNRGIIKKGKNLEFTRPWDKFIKWRETKSFILLYISENDAHIILKRSITVEKSIVMKNIIETHLGLFPSKK